jgi:hypothetical protein
MPYALYYATAPAPPDITTHEVMTRLVPVHFSTIHDALHAAALVIRGGQHAWLIEGPGLRYAPAEIEAQCKAILDVIGRRPPSA